MKKRIIFSMLFLSGILLAVQGAFAQASNKSQRQLHINASGEVSDDQGTKIGYISLEDQVFNSEGKQLGYIKNGQVYNAEGKPMGRAKKGGRYYNNSKVLMIKTKKIGDECEILDPEGHKLGTVHMNYKLHACAVHCFYKEKQMDEEKK